MSYDYEQSIWGRGMAVTNPTYPTAIRLVRALAAIKNILSGGKVLELGCGAGQFIRAVSRERRDLKCLGTDISKTAIDEAIQADGGIEYAFANGETLPYGAKTLDAVLIFDVLEHVENPRQVLREVERVLKPGGIMYAFVPCEGDFTSLWNALDKLGLKKDLTKRFAGHIQYFSRKSLEKIIENSKLKIVNKSYSEHVVGQLAGILAFILMSRASAKYGGGQVNNEEVFGGNKGKFFRSLSRFVNFIIYVESVVFCKISSPNFHVVAKKV